jgi:hypothetical protein
MVREFVRGGEPLMPPSERRGGARIDADKMFTYSTSN